MPESILSILVFLPLLAALISAVLPRKVKLEGAVCVLALTVTFALSCWLYADFPADSSDFHYLQKVSWIPFLGIDYHVGLDGIGLILVTLTTFLGLITALSMLGHAKYASKEFVISFLILTSAMLGTFVSLDVFLFYVFWEAMLIPMYFMVGRFGGEFRQYASLKFFIYTMAGSLLMLLGIIWLYLMTGAGSDGTRTTSLLAFYQLQIDPLAQVTLFMLFAIAFLIKIPMFPFHTWLPDAHVEAPTPGSIILAGVLLKMGGYGLLRFAFPLFPEATQFFAPWIAGLGVFGIIYGAYVAWFQDDMKKLIAYSSVSHMGYIILGLFSLQTTSMGGAVFQMIAHGLSTGAMFLMIGFLYEQAHTRSIASFGGLISLMPRYTVLFFIITLASIALPGLCGFVGEFLILSGAFDSTVLIHPMWMVSFAVLGVILGAGYMLSMYEKVFLGEVTNEKNNSLKDLGAAQVSMVAVLIISMIYLGVAPNRVLNKISAPIEKLQQSMRIP